MLITKFRDIGNKLYTIRKRQGLTQAEVAELAELSDRTYADIERGSVNMRIETLLKLCTALHITPNDILIDTSSSVSVTPEDLLEALASCSVKEKATALQLLEVYIQSLR